MSESVAIDFGENEGADDEPEDVSVAPSEGAPASAEVHANARPVQTRKQFIRDRVAAYRRRFFSRFVALPRVPRIRRPTADGGEREHDDHEPITVVLRHDVRRKKLEQWKRWVHDLVALASSQSGYGGSFIVRDGKNYVIVSKFDTYRHWKKWVESQIRTNMMNRLEEERLIRRPAELEYPAGGIFQFSTIPAPQPPAKWKMLIILTAIFYPINLIIFYSLTAGWKEARIPPAIYILINQPISLIISIFIISPFVTYAFRGWIYQARHRPRWIPRWLFPYVC